MEINFQKKDFNVTNFVDGSFYESDFGTIMLYHFDYQLYFYDDGIVMADKGSYLAHKWQPYTGKIEINCGEKDEDS